MRRLSSFVAAAVLAAGLGASLTPASAIPMAPSPVASGAPGIEQAQYGGNWNKGRRWVGRWDKGGWNKGPWNRRPYYGGYRRPHYPHYGYYYPRRPYYYDYDPGFAFSFGVVPGIVIGSYGWKQACAAKYRSFDWNTGLYFGYDGRWHRCVLP